jgi:hypothetical protein
MKYEIKTFLIEWVENPFIKIFKYKINMEINIKIIHYIIRPNKTIK